MIAWLISILAFILLWSLLTGKPVMDTLANVAIGGAVIGTALYVLILLAGIGRR